MRKLLTHASNQLPMLLILKRHRYAATVSVFLLWTKNKLICTKLNNCWTVAMNKCASAHRKRREQPVSKAAALSVHTRGIQVHYKVHSRSPSVPNHCSCIGGKIKIVTCACDMGGWNTSWIVSHRESDSSVQWLAAMFVSKGCRCTPVQYYIKMNHILGMCLFGQWKC